MRNRFASIWNVPRGIVNRVGRMVQGRHQISTASMTPDGIQREINFLISLAERNENIRDLSGHPGWRDEMEPEIAGRIMTLLRQLPRKVVDKDPTAEADAQAILIYNQLLGLVNETLLESARIGNLVNSRIAMQERLENDLADRGNGNA